MIVEPPGQPIAAKGSPANERCAGLTQIIFVDNLDATGITES
jgi:hypothetical protein